jgi:hypothetical protein
MTPDPYKGNIAEPRSLQAYVYCLSNPIINEDEHGLSCLSVCIPFKGKLDKIKLTSERETWLRTADVLCYYFTRQRDYIQKMLSTRMVCIKFREEGCGRCEYDGVEERSNHFILSGSWTSWEIRNRFSAMPVERYMGHNGPVTVCPPRGPNFQGLVKSLIP